MAKTWENIECEFYTHNTENSNGDSQYRVTKAGMSRLAKINKDRAPDQVNAGNPCMAYLDPKGPLHELIMTYPIVDDSLYTVEAVHGDMILVRALRDPMEPIFLECTRRPAIGLCTFDFHNDNGILSHIHIGHTINVLTM